MKSQKQTSKKNAIFSRKTFSSVILVICLIIAFSSCGNEAEISADNASGDLENSQIIESEAEKHDLFSRHGLSGIVPEKYINCSLVAETSETAAILLTEYEFTVLSEIDSDLERQGYYNQILNAVKAASSDGKAYKKSENGVSPLSVYEDRVSESETLVCYFALDLNGEKKLYKLTVSDFSSQGIHLYSLALTYSDIEF